MNIIDADATRKRVEAFQRKHRTGLLTLLFTDIIGSTKLKQTLGDRKAVALIQEHHAAMREILGRFHEGEEIATVGDSFFIVFTKPSDAVKFSLLVQARLRSLATATGHSVLDRIGIHVGEVCIEEKEAAHKSKDLYGIQVDSCSRVASLGGADQILMTRFPFDSARQVLKYEELERIGPLTWLSHGAYLMKGVEEPIEVCEAGEIGSAALTPPLNSEKAQRFLSADAEPVLGWRPAIDQQVPGTSWVLEKKLGEGGFGEVWLGRDKVLKTLRVFKFCFRADRVRALKREVTLFRLLQQRVAQHPNIVSVEATYFDEPPFYVVMQHVAGSDLPQWCEQFGGVGRIPLSVRLEIVAQIADALQAAHDSGIIHRDVKPSNILVSGNETEVHAYLTDFGIGQVVSEEILQGISRMGFSGPLADSTSNTGTYLYMAPELFAGKPASTRSDIYALGMVLYQIIVGDFTHPFTGDWARRISNPLLREDLEKCFAGDPRERFAGASELAERLRTLETRAKALAAQEAVVKAREQAAYRRGILRTAVVATLLVVVFFGLALYSWQQARRADRNAQATRQTLSRSDFLQALRSISEDKDGDGLSLLARSVSLDRNNHAALCRLTALLTYRNHPIPIRRLRHDASVSAAQFSPNGKWIVTVSYKTAQIWDAESGKALAESMKHDGRVGIAQFSPNGKWIVTTSDQTARIWDAETGKALTKPIKHDGVVLMAQFSPDGKRIVTASWDGTARIWDAETGKVLTEPIKHDDLVIRAQFSPDGRHIVTASWDQTARIWDAETGKALSGEMKHDGIVDMAQFSPDGKRIVTTSHDKTARIWDAETGEALTEPIKHDKGVRTAQFSPDGRRIVTASWDQTARIWDAETGKALTEPIKHDDVVYSAQFSPDGKRILTASWDKTARIWDAQTGKALSGEMKHDGIVDMAQFSPDGKRIVTASSDNAARIWDAERGKALTEPIKHAGDVKTARFSPDGKRIVTASSDNAARIWDAQTGKVLTEPIKHDEGVKTAQFSPDGKRIVTASWDQTARIWDAETGKALTEPIKHDDVVYSAQFSPDGRRIVTASSDNAARIWDAQTGKALTEPMKHAGDVRTAQFSPDGKRIVTASWDKTARIWDAQTGDALTEPIKHDHIVYSAQFNSDGKRIVTASGTARIWNAETGKALTEPINHDGFVRTAQFSPDGKRIVTPSSDNAARIWDAETGKALTEPMKHDEGVNTAQFSPDGKRIVTASWDQTARIWDAESGKALTEPMKHADSVNTAQFSPDGKRIVTASDDNTSRIWDLMPTGNDWPEWLPRLADAIAGQHLNDRGLFEPLDEDAANVLKEIKDRLSRESAENDWVIWGRWFLADRSTRTISPFSEITVPEYIQNRIMERTAASLDEAETLAFGDSEIMKQISTARAALRN